MRQHWLTRPETIRKLWRLFIAVLIATVVAEFFVDHEGHFGIDGSLGFNAWYGFAACAVMILGAKLIGLALKRPDTYYEDRDE